MFTRCLFCHKPFAQREHLGRVLSGRRIAFDSGRGRLWAICDRCHRWNLCPLEERREALVGLEKLALDRGQLIARTDNISLLHADRLTLIRVGKAGLAEQAWWRYGRELSRRRSAYESRVSRLMSYAYGGIAFVGESLGLADVGLNVTWDDTPLADILRWRRFGWAAWRGRVRCPHCDSVLRALLYDLSWWIYPRRTADGRLGVGIPCQRCDPWTPDKVYVLEGTEAENVLRRALAYQHVAGAGDRTVRDAVHEIERSGSTEAYCDQVSGETVSLWKLGRTRSIALEIAVNERVERTLLDLEARALEELWRREEELACIIDDELTPSPLRSRVLQPVLPPATI